MMIEIRRKRWDIDFDVAKSVRYHIYRRSYFEKLDNITKIATLIIGMGAFASVVQGHEKTTLWATMAVSALAAIDIVIGFSARSRRHAELARKFSALGQEIAQSASPAETEIAGWQARRLELEADEPGIVNWLERRCAYEESEARGVEPRAAWHLNWLQWWVAPISPF
jgi:hypothetical protein